MTIRDFKRRQLIRHAGLMRSAAAVFALGLSLVGILFYITRTYSAYINSDAAVANILAGEIWRTSSFFPKDWWYVNSDFWIVFKQLPIIPFAAAGRNGFSAHAFSVVVSSSFMLWTAYAVLRQSGMLRATAAIGVALLCIGFSDVYLEIVYGEAAYSWTTGYILLILLLGMKLHAAVQQGQRSGRWWTALAAVVFMLALSNPFRFTAYIMVPIATGLACTFMLKTQPFLPLTRRGAAQVVMGIGSVGAAFVLAWLAHRGLLESLSVIQGASASVLIDLDRLPRTIGLCLLGMVSFLGVDWLPGTTLASMAGLLMLAKLCLLPALFIAPLCALRRATLHGGFGPALVGATALAGLIIMIILTATSSLQGRSAMEAIYTTRYLSPFLQLLILCNVLFWSSYGWVARAALSGAVALAVIGSIGHISPQELRQQEMADMESKLGFSFRKGWRAEVNKQMEVVNALRAEGLKVGYAPYWHSHIYTVLSKGQLEVRPLHMDKGQVRPWLHLSSSSWYRSGYADNRVFFLVPKSLEDKILIGGKNCLGTPQRQFSVDSYDVLVFDRNPLMQWVEENLNSVGRVCLQAAGLTQNGKFDPITESLIAPAGGKPGFLRFGPYVSLSRGSYRVIFSIHVGETKAASAGYVDVVADKGNKTLGRVELRPGSRQIEIPLGVNENALNDVEFRVYVFGDSEVALRGIEVVREKR